MLYYNFLFICNCPCRERWEISKHYVQKGQYSSHCHCCTWRTVLACMRLCIPSCLVMYTFVLLLGFWYHCHWFPNCILTSFRGMLWVWQAKGIFMLFPLSLPRRPCLYIPRRREADVCIGSQIRARTVNERVVEQKVLNRKIICSGDAVAWIALLDHVKSALGWKAAICGHRTSAKNMSKAPAFKRSIASKARQSRKIM